MPNPDHLASRHDIPPPQPPPLWLFGEYQVRPEVSELRRHKRFFLRQCTYYGKRALRNLRQCSLCKSVRYCDTECQRADYVEYHREECTGFCIAPFTTAFLPEPICGARYAVDRVFSYGNREGVGVWISVSGSMDCELSPLVYPLSPQNDETEVLRRLRLAEADQETSLKYKVYTSNLLTLQILVQNRRKDGLPAVILGALCQVITCAGVMEAVHTGSLGDDVERISKFQISLTLESEKKDVSSIGVAHDPWDKTPRVFVKNFNGTELHRGTTLPPAVLSASRGIVELYPGDFVLLHVQFRIGDGRRAGISKDFVALSNLFGFSLPLRSPWTDDEEPTVVEATLDASWGASAMSKGLTTMFFKNAIRECYNDIVKRGERVHIESHYGKAHVALWEQRYRQAAGQRRPRRYGPTASPYVR